jgi:TldD protein
MRERLSDALKTAAAEYTEIRIEDVENVWLSYRGPDLDSIGSARTRGGMVRALWKGGWGYSSFNDLDDLAERVREACDAARLAAGTASEFAPAPRVMDACPAALTKDFRRIPLSRKRALMEEYNSIVLGHDKRIRTSSVRYADSFRKTWYANSDGSYIEEEDPDVNLSVAAVGRDDDVVQTGFETGGGPDGFLEVEAFHDKARLAAARAVELLSARPVAGGTYCVIVNPSMAGVFAHEAFGHLSEADFIYENERMRRMMTIGTRFGAEGLSIIDDGSIPGGLGTHRYDHEGVRMGKTYLIRNGVLAGRLHSRETAAKLGEKPTGNARAVRFHHPPIVRMTNTYIDRGADAQRDMIKGIPLGVMAMDCVGGETALEMFTFSAAYGYMIRNGERAEMVRDVVLTGNVFATLMNIDGIGDTLGWHPNGPGGCGKADQAPLRVGLGGPYVRIRDCVVGGPQ